jgi:hypothetical protein
MRKLSTVISNTFIGGDAGGAAGFTSAGFVEGKAAGCDDTLGAGSGRDFSLHANSASEQSAAAQAR